MKDFIFTYPFDSLEEIHTLSPRGLDLRFNNYPNEHLSVETKQWENIREFLEWFAKKSQQESKMFQLGVDSMPGWFSDAVSKGTVVLTSNKNSDDPFNEAGVDLLMSCVITNPTSGAPLVYHAGHGDIIRLHEDYTIAPYHIMPHSQRGMAAPGASK